MVYKIGPNDSETKFDCVRRTIDLRIAELQFRFKFHEDETFLNFHIRRRPQGWIDLDDTERLADVVLDSQEEFRAFVEFLRVVVNDVDSGVLRLCPDCEDKSAENADPIV